MARPARKKAAPPAAQLRMEVDRIVTAPARPAPPAPPAPPPEPMARSIYVEERYAKPARPPFGGWLVKQKGRSEWLDKLVSCAAADRTFPKSGDPDDVRKHLGARGADGDMFEALDDAEREWLVL